MKNPVSTTNYILFRKPFFLLFSFNYSCICPKNAITPYFPYLNSTCHQPFHLFLHPAHQIHKQSIPSNNLSTLRPFTSTSQAFNLVFAHEPHFLNQSNASPFNVLIDFIRFNIRPHIISIGNSLLNCVK
jgi:hypothetical protein